MNKSYSDKSGQIFHAFSSESWDDFTKEFGTGGERIKEKSGNKSGNSLLIYAGDKYPDMTSTICSCFVILAKKNQ